MQNDETIDVIQIQIQGQFKILYFLDALSFKNKKKMDCTLFLLKPWFLLELQIALNSPIDLSQINIGLVNTDRFMSIVLIYQSLTFKVNKTKQAKVRYIVSKPNRK